ncbi:MAG: DUF21 domain-containing protein, partial [Bacilli bacterium]|nr:DUF21 domain-containing protein [Bacilli bacterium]
MEEIPDWIAIVLLVFFVCMCAFYSATETAFACLNRYKFEVEADEGKKSSSLIVRLYEHFETTLISVLIGNNVFAVLVSTFSTFLFYRWFSALMADGTLDASIVSLIASISMSLIVFLFGDTIPKFIAKKMPENVARLTVYPMTFFIILFYPFSLIFRGINFVAKKMFRAKEELPITNEDIASEIEKMEEVGELEENESDIIVNSLDFAETSVKEVLTPRTRMSMIDA